MDQNLDTKKERKKNRIDAQKKKKKTESWDLLLPSASFLHRLCLHLFFPVHFRKINCINRVRVELHRTITRTYSTVKLPLSL